MQPHRSRCSGQNRNFSNHRLEPTALSRTKAAATRASAWFLAKALPRTRAAAQPAPLGHRSKAAGGFYRRHRSHAGHHAPFPQMYGSLKTAAGASWPERIAVPWQQKVVRRALSAPQRAPRLSAWQGKQSCPSEEKFTALWSTRKPPECERRQGTAQRVNGARRGWSSSR